MFGKNIIFGKEERNIDSKGRVVIPSFTNASQGDEISILYLENNNEIELFLLKQMKDLIINLDQRMMNTNDIKLKKILDDKLECLTNNIVGTDEVDNQRRILIPKYIRKKENLEKGTTVIFTGKYKNNTSYVKCKKI